MSIVILEFYFLHHPLTLNPDSNTASNPASSITKESISFPTAPVLYTTRIPFNDSVVASRGGDGNTCVWKVEPSQSNNRGINHWEPLDLDSFNKATRSRTSPIPPYRHYSCSCLRPGRAHYQNGAVKRPVLRTINQHLSKCLIKVIVSGTGFSLDVFKTVLALGAGKVA